jgi:hypothetical protein
MLFLSLAAQCSGLLGRGRQYTAFRFVPVSKTITRLALPFYSPTRYLASLPRHRMAPSTASIDVHQSRENLAIRTKPLANGDLNNIASMRAVDLPERNPEFAYRSLGLQDGEDDAVVRVKYRPFLLSDEVYRSDWISRLELATVTELAYNDLLRTGSRLKVLILYGSLRKRSASHSSRQLQR